MKKGKKRGSFFLSAVNDVRAPRCSCKWEALDVSSGSWAGQGRTGQGRTLPCKCDPEERSSVSVIPESLASAKCHLVADKSVLEEVEDSKLVFCHDI